MIENSVFIRNISPLAKKESVLEIFNELEDEIVNIEFHKYPDSDQRFCQIDFKNSDGVTKSVSYNGSTLLGVPMSITVLPPIQITKIEQNRIHSNKEIFVKNLPYSESKIYSLFEKYGNIARILKLEDPYNSSSTIIEFQDEGTALSLIEKKYIILDNGDRVDISKNYDLEENQHNEMRINSDLPNLESISVPLAYQQIKKIEWDNKIHKLSEIKKRIENRILSENYINYANEGQSLNPKISIRGRSFSRSISPI